MEMFSSDFAPPDALNGPGFTLFMTDLQYSKPDFEAVMKSKPELRLWPVYLARR